MSVLFLGSFKPLSLSVVSVVFDINPSPNAVAPVFSILLSDDLMRLKQIQKRLFLMCLFFSAYMKDQVL